MTDDGGRDPHQGAGDAGDRDLLEQAEADTELIRAELTEANPLATAAEVERLANDVVLTRYQYHREKRLEHDLLVGVLGGDALDLTDRDLSDLDLAALVGEFLPGANLTRADLRGANLRGANLCGVRWTGTILTGAILTGASYNQGDIFMGARWTAGTITW